MPSYSGDMNAEEIGAVADFILNSLASSGGEEAVPLTLADTTATDLSDDGGATSSDDGRPLSLFTNEAGEANDIVSSRIKNERLSFAILVGLLVMSGTGYVWTQSGRSLERQNRA